MVFGVHVNCESVSNVIGLLSEFRVVAERSSPLPGVIQTVCFVAPRELLPPLEKYLPYMKTDRSPTPDFLIALSQIFSYVD